MFVPWKLIQWKIMQPSTTKYGNYEILNIFHAETRAIICTLRVRLINSWEIIGKTIKFFEQFEKEMSDFGDMFYYKFSFYMEYNYLGDG